MSNDRPNRKHDDQGVACMKIVVNAGAGSKSASFERNRLDEQSLRQQSEMNHIAIGAEALACGWLSISTSAVAEQSMPLERQPAQFSSGIFSEFSTQHVTRDRACDPACDQTRDCAWRKYSTLPVTWVHTFLIMYERTKIMHVYIYHICIYQTA